MSTSPIPAKPKGVKNEFFASSRITVHSMLPFSRVIENLTLELGDPNLPIWRTIVASVTRKNRDKKAAFELEIKNAIGKHGFMAFHVGGDLVFTFSPLASISFYLTTLHWEKQWTIN